MTNVIKKINVDGVEYDIQGKELTKVTYAELKQLRDNGELVEGHLYRITDYEFTTVQAETKSAGHVFDIIVLATSTNELSHIARAIAHEGDTYFDGNDLGAWELWYELDNDTDKYGWADATNGKGVIYRMIDEKRNDCPYDFKNALFYNKNLITGTTSDKYYYTFSYVVKSVLYDGTVETQVKNCYGNSMGVMKTPFGKKEMNMTVFSNWGFSDSCHSNTFGNNCYSNTFWNNCHSNTFGDSFRFNTFGSYCSSNTFGYNCYSNTFGDYCYSNTFGDSCHSNTFGHYCYSNTFWRLCSSNTFGGNVRNREVNNEKTSITLNDEYYDDGGGQLVPVKHPDLSTQPSILPYKFMGNYVYEQLIPVIIGQLESHGTYFSHLIDMSTNSDSGVRLEDVSQVINWDKSAIIEIDVIGLFIQADGTLCMRPMVIRDISYNNADASDFNFSGITIEVNETKTYGVADYPTKGYVRIVYTSMPEDGGYYGYNNY